MALLVLGVVVLGFWQSYFVAGMVRAKLPNVLVHIHGALFVFWIFFLVIQTSLVAVGKVRWHMTLGICGVILLPLMIVFGVLTLFDSIRRNGTGLPPELLLAGRLSEPRHVRRAYRVGLAHAAQSHLPQTSHDPRHHGHSRSRH